MWFQYPLRLSQSCNWVSQCLRNMHLSCRTSLSHSGIYGMTKIISVGNIPNCYCIQTLQHPIVNYIKNITRGMAMDVESVPPPYEYIDPKSEEEVNLLIFYAIDTTGSYQFGKSVNVFFITPDGKETKVRGKIGDNLLLLALRYNVDIEGACEAQLACTSCHVYVDEKYEDMLEERSNREDDLLDAAPFLKPNSRLGCQIILKKELDGLRLTIPQATINFYVDGHKPKKH